MQHRAELAVVVANVELPALCFENGCVQPRHRNVGNSNVGFSAPADEEVFNLPHVDHVHNFVDRGRNGLEHKVAGGIFGKLVIDNVDQFSLFVFHFKRILLFAQFAFEPGPVKSVHCVLLALDALLLEPALKTLVVDKFCGARTLTRLQKRIGFWTFLLAQAHPAGRIL